MHPTDNPNTLAPSSSSYIGHTRPTFQLRSLSSRTPFAKNASNESAYSNEKKLGFFGPTDPITFPLHMKLFLGGILVFPLWWLGAIVRCDEADSWSTLWQFRCRALTIISALVISGAIVVYGLSILD